MRTETKKTSVTLMSWTQYPVETIYCEWQLSRTDDPVPTPQEVHLRISDERMDARECLAVDGRTEDAGVGPFETEVRKVFEDCISMKLPLAETLDFVFAIEHCPIALREQMVRHRVGHKFGGQLGADIIPDLTDSTYWAQTMRVKNMGSFAVDGEYLLPDWLEKNGDAVLGESKEWSELRERVRSGESKVPPLIESMLNLKTSKKCMTVRDFYHDQMRWIQSAYNRLVKAGMPAEDARNLLPLGCQHRLTWKMNLSAIQHVLSKRSCWIAQLGMWKPVIHGIVNELATKVDPYFRRLVDPPCIGRDGNFEACRFSKENENRLPGGIDPYPPCSLWLNSDWEPKDNEIPLTSKNQERYLKMSTEFAQLWGRDPNTGERKQLS